MISDVARNIDALPTMTTVKIVDPDIIFKIKIAIIYLFLGTLTPEHSGLLQPYR